VIFDEFHGYVTFSQFKRLCDDTPLSVEVKNGHVDFLSKRIVFISNDTPFHWYKYNELGSDALEAMRNRITLWCNAMKRDGFVWSVNEVDVFTAPIFNQ